MVGEEVRFGEAQVRFVDQPHGGLTSLGLRFDEALHSVGYAIDFSSLTSEMAALYEGVDVWIADCLTRKPHPTHMHLDGVLSAARELHVGQLYLVHMGNGLDYRGLLAELPDWAAPAFDGTANLNFAVGATLVINPNQTPGQYTGTYAVTVNF